MIDTEIQQAAPTGTGASPHRQERLWAAVEVVGLAVTTVVAVALRADRLMTVPAFTDESMEVLLALDALAAGRLNLVGVSSFLGGLHTWLLMAVLAVFGGVVEGPRLLSLAAGVLTVLLTWALGRELAGRWAGLLAGGLLATNLAHIAINSRIAWSNCVTPLFTTAGLLLLVRALGRDRPRLLVPAGLLLGLGLQTHPSALALYPGLAAGLLLSPTGRRWLRGPWTWLGLLAALVAYGNVLWFNLTSGGKSLAAAREREYAVRPPESAGELAANLGALLLQLARNLGSSFEAAVGAPAYPVTATMVGVIALTAVGLLVCLRRRQWLLPVLLGSSVVLMALIGGEYQPVPHSSSRYLAPLWPALLALAGLGATVLGRVLLGSSRPDAPAWPRLRPAALALLAGLCLLLVSEPALTARRYVAWYAEQPWLGSSNQFALDITSAAARSPGRPVYLDYGLNDDRNTDGGTVFRSLSMGLRVHGNTPVSLARNQRQTLAAVWEKLGGQPGLAVLRRDQVRRLQSEGATLTPVGEASRVVDPAAGEYRLYEVSRQQAHSGRE